MDIVEIANNINNYIQNNETILKDFQYLRRKAKDKSGGENDFFSSKTIYGKYAFHYGGRREIQFNIGEEDNLFRYGLAYSLESSQTLPEPEITLNPSVKKYNDFIQKNLTEYDKYVMWCWSKGQRSDILPISAIPSNWVERGNFIFVGKYINKNLSTFDISDIQEIVNTFEDLFEVYKYVELTTKKIAKLCWNDEGWIKPSGLDGKSKDSESYERKHGFGHEEWLFDLDKMINGHHYAAIQPIGKYQNKYADCFFDILLYTYNSKDKIWYWVAELNNIQAINTKEALYAYEQYKENGWLREMQTQLKHVSADYKELDDYNQYTFNIKFKPNNLHLFQAGLKPFNENEKITHNRYTLLNLDQLETLPVNKQEYEIVHKENSKERQKHFIRSFKANEKEYSNLHGLIQDSFYLYLKRKHPMNKITKEATITGINKNIDIFQERDNGLDTIYEVKSYTDIITSLRVAIGQLLEYAYFPNRFKKMKLVLVTHKIIEKETKDYISNLNNLFNLNVGIVGFDFKKGKIIGLYNYDL